MEKTVVKGLSLLEALAQSDTPRRIGELSRELGLSKSNVHRLLETLMTQGYVRRANGAGFYDLTLKVWHLGSRVISRLDMKSMALTYLRKLRDTTNETARLSILKDSLAVCIEQVESEHPVRVQTEIGGTLLLYCSSTGKAMLAFQPPAFIDQIAMQLEKFTPYCAGNRDELLRELGRARKDGYAINRGERLLDVVGVAAPVRDSSNNIIAAIGISGPVERLSLRKLRRYGPLVRQNADLLSRDLGAVYAADLPEKFNV